MCIFGFLASGSEAKSSARSPVGADKNSKVKNPAEATPALEWTAPN